MQPQATSWADPLVGSRIGDYQVEKVLGEGGMGRVYAGVDVRNSRRVAIKVIAEEHARDAELVARFYAEANAASRIRHPSIIEVLALTYLADGRPAIVMELVDGETLRAAIAAGPVSLAKALEVIGQVLDAISAAHASGIVHRDLKPDNVVITPAGLAKVLDFGIAKLAANEPGHAAPRTRTGMMLGTPDYMAPEQITGTAIDTRTDIYAMGAVLFETLTGRRPFEAESQFMVLRAHLEMPPPWIGDSRPDVPDAISRIVVQAMAKSPAERFPTAIAMRDALIVASATSMPISTASPSISTASPSISIASSSNTAHGSTGPASTAASTRATSRRSGSRVAIVAALAALIAIAVIAVIVVVQRHRVHSPAETATASPPPPSSTATASPTTISSTTSPTTSPPPPRTDAIQRISPDVLRVTPPTDVQRYDLAAAMPAIDRWAREIVPDARLYFIDADNVRVDGTIDLAAGSPSLFYWSPSVVAKRPVELAANQPYRAPCQVVVHLSAQLFQVSRAIDACATHPPAPVCTLRDVWDRAQKKKHAKPAYVARIAFIDGMWDFNIYNVPGGDEVSFQMRDDCK